jgi:hypothetical protein
MSVSDALPDGRAAVLRAQLKRVVAEFDTCESLRDLKALSVEIRDLHRELDEVEPPKVEKAKTALDELNERRESKRKTG